MISVEEADQLILHHLPLWPAVKIPLSHAHHKILRQSVLAERNCPPYNRVTMDGIALHSQEWKDG
ncbi:MAG: molybdopterin molybdenumtransferase MoeA, partial [Pseudomonadota bacterium]